jgi:flagellar hook protein FlgE
LQSQNGQSYTATQASGTPTANAANTNGAGNLVTSSVEGSNVDIATEFSKLIVAQQAYSANAKMVTTANQMLQTTIDMKQ